MYKEWAPGAIRMTFFGDFNNWNRDKYVCVKDDFGVFNLTLKAGADGKPIIKHLQQYKIEVTGPDGTKKDKNSAWASYQI